jgi:hypothetical protein
MDDTHPNRPTLTSEPTAIGWVLDSLMSRRTTSSSNRLWITDLTVFFQPVFLPPGQGENGVNLEKIFLFAIFLVVFTFS